MRLWDDDYNGKEVYQKVELVRERKEPVKVTLVTEMMMAGQKLTHLERR